MKRIIMCVMLLILSVQLSSIEKLKQHPKPTPEMTFYVCYLFFKEMLYTYTVLPFWIEYETVRQAAIYCNGCNYVMNSFYMYGCLVGMGDSCKITELKQLWYEKDIDTIAQFLLVISRQEEFECPRCMDYVGWYIKVVKYSNVE